jgi:hypothetical protein
MSNRNAHAGGGSSLERIPVISNNFFGVMAGLA